MSHVRTLSSVLFAVGIGVSVAYAPRIQGWSYDDLKDKSDLVVIAVPMATADTDERLDLPGFRTLTTEKEEVGVSAIGVETQFEVSVVMKGSKRIGHITLHHYRLAIPAQFEDVTYADGSVVVNLGVRPSLVSFDPSSHLAYLMFLVREADGRYAPTSGQTHPGVYSIHPLQGRASNQEANRRVEATSGTRSKIREASSMAPALRSAPDS